MPLKRNIPFQEISQRYSKIDSFFIHSFSKINLGLIVYKPRLDGYHPLCSIFQTISLADTISVSLTSEKHLTLTCSNKELRDQRQNILYKIYEKYVNIIPFGMNIHLVKNIPLGAGLGGGSANAAAFLHFLNEQAKWNYPLSKLVRMGVKFGADIPFFLYGGTALVRGIGENITPLTLKTSDQFLIINPGITISTPSIFKAFDNSDFKAKRPGRTPKTIYALEEKNYLQSIVFEQYPEIAQLANTIEKELNCIVEMSGSGSTLFIRLNDRKKANTFIKLLNKKYPQYFIQLVKPERKGFIIKNNDQNK